MLDKELVNELRKLMNSNSDYILNKYRNQEGKNRWNIICSAMDWIDVAVDNYNNFKLESNSKNMNAYCLEIYSFISTIDIIYEAVNQLHRVFTGETKVIYKGKKEIFNSIDGQDDNNHFKHIRAIFGAHPVNLSNNKKEKWFASWPTKDYFGKFDLQVFLYPLDSEGKTITFGIQLDNLRRFAESRYGYIKDIIYKIQNEFFNYSKKCHDRDIKFTNDDIINLRILKDEHEKRLPNDYIRGMIDDAILVMNTVSTITENSKIVNGFRDQVKKAILDLEDAVQKIDYEERESYSIFDVDFPHEHSYEFSKYFEVLGGKYDGLENYYFKVIREVLSNYVVLDEYMSNDEKYMLICAGLQKWKGKSNQ